MFISVAGAPAVTALAATDLRRATIPMVASLTGFAAAAVVWVVAAPRQGTAAIAAGYALGSLIQVAAPIVVASRRYRPPWSGMWLRAVLATALVAGAALAAAPTLPRDAAVLVILGVLLLPELRMLRAGLRPRRH